MKCVWVWIGALAVAQPALCAPGIGKPGTLAQEMAAARRAGLPLTPKELIRRPPVRDVDNAAPFYRKLDALVTARPLTKEESDVVESRTLKADAAPEDIAAAVAFMARRKDIMDVIHRAAAKPDCDFQRDWSKGPSLLFPEFARLRQTARLLSCEANVQLHGGDALGALRTCASIGKLARHASSDPHLIAHLADYTIGAIGMSRIEAILQERHEANVARAAAAAASSYGPRPIAAAISGEAVMAMVTIEMLRSNRLSLSELTGGADEKDNGVRSGPKLSSGMLDANAAYVLWFFRQTVGALRQPYPLCRQVVSELIADQEARAARRDLTTLIGMVVLPMLGNLGDSAARRVAHQGALRATAAALEWRARRRALPRTLAECMKRVPLDPFDGKPLRYRVEDKGFVVYSVGPTGEYAGAPRVPGKPFRETAVRWPGR